MKSGLIASAALAAIWFMAPVSAHAGCGTLGSAKAEDAPVYACTDNSTQLASALPGAELVPASTVPSGPIYPADNGNGRYICTPSGFGHIATCSQRIPSSF